MAKTIRQTLRGRSDFTSDIYVRDMLYAATVRSPFASARIRRIDASDLPEGITCVTALSVAGPNALVIDDEEMPIIARDVTRYVGEPVALLAGPSQRAVVEAATHLEIEYEELAPASKAREGMDWSDRSDPDELQVARRMEGRRGDGAAALAACARQVEARYDTGAQEHLYNEPQGAFVDPDEDGMLIVRTATQWPYHVRRTVAANIGIDEERCVVRPTDPGISLDGKLWYPSLVATHAALLAVHSGRPVKLVYSTGEDYRFTTKRSPFTMRYQAGLDAEDRLQALVIDVAFNVGAYPLFTREMSERVIAAAVSQYRCPNVEISVTAVRTNLPPLNVHSGFGGAAAFFATESHIDRISQAVGADPGAWRADQLNMEDRDLTARAREVLNRARSLSDFARKHAAYELLRRRRGQPGARTANLRTAAGGIGIALAFQGSGFMGDYESRFQSSVTVRLESDGQAVLRTSAVPGSRAVMANWRASIALSLGLSPDGVRIEAGDTALAPDSGPSTLSRNVTVIGRLIEQACSAIQKKRFRSPLPIEVRRTHRPARSGRWDGATLRGLPYQRMAYGAAVVETTVDPVTFESTITHVWLVVDAGLVIDEAAAMRALEMSVHQALEWATHELIVYRDGAVDPRSYLAYRNVWEPVMPTTQITLVQSTERDPAGIGELPQSCVPAAVAAAIGQAAGRPMNRIPTNPALIHDSVETG